MATVTVTAAEARTMFGELLSRVGYGGERVVITRRDKEVAALVSEADLRRLEQLEDERDAELLRLAKEVNKGDEYVGVQELLAAYEARTGRTWAEDGSDV